MEYKAMIFLLQNDKAACINILSNIPSDAAKYDQTQELIKKLR